MASFSEWSNNKKNGGSLTASKPATAETAAGEKYNTDYDAYRSLLRGQRDAADYISRAEALEKEADTLANRAKALARETGANGKWTNNTELSQARIRAWESAWGGTGAQDGSGTDNRTARQLNDEADAKRKEAAQLRQKAETAQGYYYSSIPLAEDFAEKSKAAESKAGTLNPVYITEDQRGDLVYDFINNLNGTRETVKALNGWTGQDGAFGDYTPYAHMTDDEIGTYNYLYATQGKEEAENYLDKLANTLNYRLGTEKYENMAAPQKLLYWLPQGLDRFATGIGQLFSEEALPTSPTQYAGSMVQREAAELGAQRDENGQVQYDEDGKMIGQSLLGKAASFAYGVGTSISNMAPSILASYVSSGLLGGAAAGGAMSAATAGKLASAAGTVAMGASTAGNAYKAKLDEGWTQDQARSYAALVGLSEGALQYALGGISALSGGNALGEKALSKVLGQIAKLDNGLMKTALNFSARLAISGFGEGLEEGLQEVLEPLFATMITGQDYDVDWGDVGYAFLMGFATSAVFETPGAFRAARASTALDIPRFSSAGMESYLGANGVDYFAGCQSAEDVKIRYRELAREHHPDAGGSQTVMAEINRQRTIREAFYTGTQKAAESARRAAEPETGTYTAREPESAQRARETATAPQTETFQDVVQAQVEGRSETAPGGTAVNENGLTALTELERTNLSSGARNKIVSTFQEAVSFIRNALTNRQSNARAYMGKIPDSVAAQVLTDTGVDIQGYTAILPSDAIRHMFKHHGDAATEASRGQVALTEQSAALLPAVLSSPDRVTFSNQADAYGRPTLMFEKQIGDLYITAQAVTEGKKVLTTDTLYVRKTKAPPATADETGLSPSQTSETGNRSTLSDDSVSQPGTSVNTGTEGPRLPTVEDAQVQVGQDAGGIAWPLREGSELPRLTLPTVNGSGTGQEAGAAQMNQNGGNRNGQLAGTQPPGTGEGAGAGSAQGGITGALPDGRGEPAVCHRGGGYT